ncbi:MAG: thioredoxin domain-containing protein [Polyangiales bacterium]
MTSPLEPRTARGGSALRALCAVALAFSSAAAVDYYGRSHAFCAEGSGCDAVRSSELGRSIGLGLPALGVLGFGAVLLASLAGSERLRRLAVVGALTGGVTAVGLLGLQLFVIGALCAICTGVDLAAIGAGLLALPLLTAPEPCAQPGPLGRRIWRGAGALAIGVPLSLALSLPPRLPSWVTALTVPGKINVVELSDFECPFCRAMHPVLMGALTQYRGRVSFVRKCYPLPGHVHARGAARAFLCAQAQGRGEAMADFLFASEDLSVETAARHAEAFGLDRARFSNCVADPSTDRAIDAQMAAVRAAGFEGLPMVFIGPTALLGFDAQQGAVPYLQALARAASPASAAAVAAPWVVLTVMVLLLLWPTRKTRSLE